MCLGAYFIVEVLLSSNVSLVYNLITSLCYLTYRDLNLLDLANIYGIVINKFYKPKCLGLEIPIKRRHWLTVRKIDENFYNLDSKLDVPECIGNDEHLIKFLKSELAVSTTELFLVVSNSVPEDSWMKVDAG